MKTFLAAALLIFAASRAAADVITIGLNRSLANSLYCQLAGCTMTGKVRFINGTAAAPSGDSAAGAGFHFTAAAFAIDVAGVTTTICGVGCAAGSAGSYGWRSTADATVTADLKLARGGAKLLDILGSSAGGLRIDASSFTATRAWNFNVDAADTFVGLVAAQTLTNKTFALFQSTTAKVLIRGTGTGATQLAATQTTPPTCSSNCGTSPSVVGTDTAGIVTMGATGVPVGGFVVTFNGTWASAPACVATMALAGMAAGKLPLTIITTTTTITFNLNGTAPANSDKYAYICVGTQ